MSMWDSCCRGLCVGVDGKSRGDGYVLMVVVVFLLFVLCVCLLVFEVFWCFFVFVFFLCVGLCVGV